MNVTKTPPPLKTLRSQDPKPAWKTVSLFLVAAFFLGPLAAPILWRNENVSSVMRWTLTLAVTALTVYLVYFTYTTVDQQLAPVMEMMQQN